VEACDLDTEVEIDKGLLPLDRTLCNERGWQRKPIPNSLFPSLLWCERFPVLLHREFALQGIELPCRLEPKNAAEGRNLQNSLLNSLFSREFDAETGSSGR
jgi:hypothetical protein